MLQGIAAFEATGTGVGEPWHLSLLAQAYARTGRAQEGLKELAKALDVSDQRQQRFYDAELHRLTGELLLQSGRETQTSAKSRTGKAAVRSRKAKGNESADSGAVALEAEAESHFLKAIEVAREQQAKALELRAVMSLHRLFQKRGEPDKVRQMLEETCGWFTEGFDTADLQEAQALLRSNRVTDHT
jgi:predicted ATPase